MTKVKQRLKHYEFSQVADTQNEVSSEGARQNLVGSPFLRGVISGDHQIGRLADDNLQTNPINNRTFIDEEYNRAFL